MSLSGMLVNTVDHKIFGPPTNVNGANVPSETIVSGVRASVQQSSAAARGDQDIEGTTASGKVFYDHDPGLAYGDIITWKGTRDLVAQGPAIDEAGRGVLFTIRYNETI